MTTPTPASSRDPDATQTLWRLVTQAVPYTPRSAWLWTLAGGLVVSLAGIAATYVTGDAIAQVRKVPVLEQRVDSYEHATDTRLERIENTLQMVLELQLNILQLQLGQAGADRVVAKAERAADEKRKQREDGGQ